MDLLATLRDLAIIFLAIMWIVLLLVIIFILLKVKSLIDQLPQRINPLLDSARHTATTVEETATSLKGTASFVNRTTVTPIIRVAAIGAAATRFVQVLLGRHRRGG
jgi:hypothetical protein